MPEANEHHSPTEDQQGHWIPVLSLAVSFLTFVVLTWTLIEVTQYTRAAKRSTKLMHQSVEASQRSADAAKSSAESAKAAVESAEKNSRLDQRAWVGIGKNIIPELKVGTRTAFGIEMVNSGKTPALKVTARVIARSVLKGERLNLSYPKKDPGGVGILYPGMSLGVMDLDTEKVFTENDVNDFTNKKRIVYLFGKISYFDIFKQPHCAMFCMSLSADFSIASMCDTYSDDTDNECPKDEETE